MAQHPATASATPSSEIPCPKCDFGTLMRTRRVGILERSLYTLFGFYPWKCSDCRRRIFLRKRRTPLAQPIPSKLQPTA